MTEASKRAAVIVDALHAAERASSYLEIVKSSRLIPVLHDEFEKHKKQPIVIEGGNTRCTCRSCGFFMGIIALTEMVKTSVALLDDITGLVFGELEVDQ